MPINGPVSLPADEYLSRPLIVAWLGYPLHSNFRVRAVQAIQDWARWQTGAPRTGRRARVEATLRVLEKEVNRQLLAGEIFRQQVCDAEDKLFGFPRVFKESSTNSFANRVEALKLDGLPGNWIRLDARNAMRDLWAKRRASMSLAVGACHGFSSSRELPRPDLQALLFGKRDWALAAIREAELIRRRAIAAKHPSATQLIEFRIANF